MRHVRNILFTVLLTLLFVAPAYADTTLPEGLLVIEEQAFLNDTALTGELIIPEGVTEIGAQAFKGCTGITSVVIPDSVVKIGAEAFSGCTGLEGDLLLRYYVDMGDGCFDGVAARVRQETDISCFEYEVVNGAVTITGFYESGVTDVIIPARVGQVPVTKIGDEAFSTCGSLKSVWIPVGVTDIGTHAFDGCSRLASVRIPEGVTNIGEYCFNGCSNLASVIIPYGVSSIDTRVFYGCSRLTEVKIPNSVTSIGLRAFEGCSSLTSITIPDSVTSIGKVAFQYCSALKSIRIPESVKSIGQYAFACCCSLTSVNIPDGVTCLDQHVFACCCSLTNISIPESVTSIYKGAFYLCSSLTSISIPDSVSSIGEYAFESCSKLRSVKLPERLTKVNDRVFYGCSSLTSVRIPDGVTSIGAYVFTYCSAIREIQLSASLKTVDAYCFAFCTSLKSMTFPDGFESIKAWRAFEGCSNIESIILPDSTTYIARCSFGMCESLKSFVIPPRITTIYDCTFYGCRSLTDIVIPNAVTTIENNAFYDCQSLVSVTIPDSVVYFDTTSAFERCYALETVRLPASLTAIRYNAFKDCRRLRSIVIPDRVSSIDSYAFANCSSLEFVVLPDNLSVSNRVFASCSTDLHIMSRTEYDDYIAHPVKEIKVSGSGQYWPILRIPYEFEICWKLNRDAIPNGGYNVYLYVPGETRPPYKLNNSYLTGTTFRGSSEVLMSIREYYGYSVNVNIMIEYVDTTTGKVLYTATNDEEDFRAIRTVDELEYYTGMLELGYQAVVLLHDIIHDGKYQIGDETYSGGTDRGFYITCLAYKTASGKLDELDFLPTTRGALMAIAVMEDVAAQKPREPVMNSMVKNVMALAGFDMELIDYAEEQIVDESLLQFALAYRSDVSSDELNEARDAYHRSLVASHDIDQVELLFNAGQDALEVVDMVLGEYAAYHTVTRNDVQPYIDAFRESGSDSLRYAADCLEVMTAGDDSLITFLLLLHGGQKVEARVAQWGYEGITKAVLGPEWGLFVSGVDLVANVAFNAAEGFSAQITLMSLVDEIETIRNQFGDAYEALITQPCTSYDVFMAECYKPFIELKDAMLRMTKIELEQYTAVKRAAYDSPVIGVILSIAGTGEDVRDQPAEEYISWVEGYIEPAIKEYYQIFIEPYSW